MSIYDKASLVQIPSGYNAGTLYSVLPNTSDGDFTHDRNLTTATRVNKDGLIESVAADVPRLDYPLIDGVVQDCPTLLLEPQRTNLLSYSEDFSQPTRWLVSSMTVTTDDAVAPDGSQTADKAEATGAGSIRTNNSYTVTSGYSFSIFVKKGNSRYVTLRSFAFTTSAIIGFDLDTETAQTGGVIEKYPNDWYRLSISKDVSSDADKNGFFYIYLPNSLGSTVSVSGNYAYFWGAQLEDADYLTSYIPVLGLSAVTRSADACSGAGNSTVFNDSEGVLFAEIANIDENNTTDTVSISISDGTLNNAVTLYYFATGDIYYDIFNSSGTRSGNASMTKSEQSNFNRIALKYKSTDISLWVNGFELSTNSGTLTLSGLSELAFDYGNGNLDFYGKTKQLMTFKTALSDSELEQITSWTSFNEMAKGQLYTIE